MYRILAVTEGIDPTTIGAFVSVILAFLGVAKIMLNQASKDREADRQERIRLAEAIQLMADNSGKNADNMGKLAKYTKEGNVQSAQRNGHLGEQNENIVKMILSSNEQTAQLADIAVKNIITGVQNIKTQHIHDQKVDNATVINETVTNKGE